MPDFKPVKSSNIAAMAHDGGAMYVKFHSGNVWKYDDVPSHLHDTVATADSVGKAFHKAIKGRYDGTKVEE